MSVAGLLIRFAAIYTALLGGVAMAFSLLGLKANSGVNAGALIGAVLAACLWYANKNKRYLTVREKRSAFLGMWAIDLALQALVTFALGAAMLSYTPVLIALAFVVLLHGAGIYVAIGLAGKQYAKQVAKVV